MNFRAMSATKVMLMVLTIATLLTAATHLQAQTGNGSILGTVLDAAGATVAGAQITIMNQDTGTVLNIETTASGLFDAPSVPAGNYTVKVTLAGFAPYEVRNVVVTVGSATQINPKLEVGSISQQVIVSDTPPEVQTTTAEISSVMQDNTIADIPLNARDLQQLAQIEPGVNLTQQFKYGAREISVTGSRPQFNQYRQEGMDQAFSLGIAPANGVGVEMGVEAVKEFSVLGGEFTPQYGGAGGSSM